jgi:GrpB-like predicted nucleotidyltransferase (UPF0157 family)
MNDETLKSKIARVLSDPIEPADYDPRWPRLFRDEKEHLLSCLPGYLVKRIEHFGSTAIPGMPAKPIIDILVEVTSLEDTKKSIAPILQAQGYDYFWRPTIGDDTPPFYAWFIKRDARGRRTHHIHMVERDFPQWQGLVFRDYLIAHPEVADRYAELKRRLALAHPDDRVAYTFGKTEFVKRITSAAAAD